MTYRGFWIVCRSCLFPIRLPYMAKTSLSSEKTRSMRILLACPVCAHVEQYGGVELKAITFRSADPFRQKKAALYVVEAPCAAPHCDRMAKIYAVAATCVSVASLLELWKHWVIHSRCQGHSFKACRYWMWGVYGVHPLQWQNPGQA
jgi:hypothetical protein